MTPKDPTPRDPWMIEAMSALGEACQLPRDLEDTLLATEEIASLFSLSEGAPRPQSSRSNENESPANAPESGVFDSPGSIAARGALSALADDCLLPPDLEARILNPLFEPTIGPFATTGTLANNGALANNGTLAAAPSVAIEAPAPVISLPVESPAIGTGALTGILRRAKKDASRDLRMGLAAAFGALLVTLLGLFAGPSKTMSAAPVHVNASPMAANDPAFAELGLVLTAMLGDIARECRVDLLPSVVWFERSGQVSVLDVAAPRNAARPGDPACVERVAARHRIGAHDRPILVQVASRDGAAVAAGEVRVTAWWVHEDG